MELCTAPMGLGQCRRLRWSSEHKLTMARESSTMPPPLLQLTGLHTHLRYSVAQQSANISTTRAIRPDVKVRPTLPRILAAFSLLTSPHLTVLPGSRATYTHAYNLLLIHNVFRPHPTSSLFNSFHVSGKSHINSSHVSSVSRNVEPVLPRLLASSG
jgi:hypothetical protein